ncbi:MAG: four helix bundle protein [Patescibacteria group bacterium]|nr:four helix bundle protein [Patescibacteria group bacterium]
MRNKIDITHRTREFAIVIVNLSKKLPKNPAGFAIGSQIIRSGTSIGANVEEAQDAISKKEFIHSMNIALKEARETYYWLIIIKESKLIGNSKFIFVLNENIEIIKILRTIVKKSKLK